MLCGSGELKQIVYPDPRLSDNPQSWGEVDDDAEIMLPGTAAGIQSWYQAGVTIVEKKRGVVTK